MERRKIRRSRESAASELRTGGDFPGSLQQQPVIERWGRDGKLFVDVVFGRRPFNDMKYVPSTQDELGETVEPITKGA
jgi:hypothetical protein